MKFTKTELPGVILIDPEVFQDPRGFFFESFHLEKFKGGGIDVSFVQDNHSKSAKGTLRGLHAQYDKPQGKLVRVIEGEIFDVAVDIRKDSPTFKKWNGVVLSASNFRQLYVPPGFAHGFCVTSEAAQVEYKCTELYNPKGEVSIQWNDPALAIQWPIEKPLLSKKDSLALPLEQSLGQITV